MFLYLLRPTLEIKMRIYAISLLFFLFLRPRCARILGKVEVDNLTLNTYPRETDSGRNLPQYHRNGPAAYQPDYLTGNNGQIRFEGSTLNPVLMPANAYQIGPKYPNLRYPAPIIGRPGLNYNVQGAQHTGYHGHAGYPGTGNAYAPGYQSYYAAQFNQKTLAQQAISAVTDAMASIALYDDKQCVPRLLCEVSSGRTTQSPTMLKVTAGLDPLLKLLQTYNGVSSSPLFLFGRAAVLGMTSKGHPAACHSAYPECPTDPDKLLNYLNNHNGGFFRFFGKHKKHEPQNLEQFYQQLSNQYDIKQPKKGFQTPFNLYNEKKSHNENSIASTNIEERIQNKPTVNNFEVDLNKEYQSSKWIFPDEYEWENPKRKRKSKRLQGVNVKAVENILKFPEPSNTIANTDKYRDSNMNQNKIFFPDDNIISEEANYQINTPNDQEEYVFDYEHNFYVKRPKTTSNNRDNYGTQTLYIVRGNANPSYPEIVTVRPEQKP